MIKEIRCGKCGRLLAKASGGRLEIQCQRCKTLNHYDSQRTAECPERAPTAPERGTQ